MKNRPVTLPRGSRRAIVLAFDIAIRALDGRPPEQIPAVRPRLAHKLRTIMKQLRKEKIVSP